MTPCAALLPGEPLPRREAVDRPESLPQGQLLPAPPDRGIQAPIRTVTERPYLKPRGRTGNPGLYRLRSFRLLEFFEYGRGNQNPPKELRKHVGMINEDQVVQWRRVGDDDHAV